MKKTVLSFIMMAPLFLMGQVINIPDDYPSIQQGIDAAENGDTVLVQPGTYYENLFIDNKSIRLLSTFVYTNDPQAIAETIIDADSTCTGIFINVAGPGMEIAGFTLQNGYCPDSPGGGLEIHGSSVFVRDMVIANNYAMEGGGIFCEGSVLLFLDCNIINNTALGHGGGIKTFNTHIYLDRCQITFNNGGAGAGIRCDYSAPFQEVFNATLDSCLVASNTASGQTGGAYFRRDGQNTELNLSIRRSSFSHNAADNSGALQVRGDSIFFEIEGCRFMNNEVMTYTAGAVFMQGSSGEVENCVFGQNNAGLGGGYWNTGGVTCWASGEVFFTNCTFYENTAPYGAGLTVGPGATAFVGNSILWGNANQQIAVLANTPEAFGTLMIDYTDIQYGQDSVRVDPNAVLNWGDYNMDVDPLFAGTGDDICELTMDSPCIDAGPEDVSGWEILPYDILGNVRVWDGDDDGTAVIDMGAYEFGAPIYIGIPEHPIKSLNGIVIKKIYPNPVSDLLTIDYEMPEEGEVLCKIYSIDGQMVSAYNLHGSRQGTFHADVGHLSPGLYLINFYSESSFALRKIIIQ